MRSESTVSPSSPDVARSTPHSHNELPIAVWSSHGNSVDESARVDRAIHSHAGPRSPFEQTPLSGGRCWENLPMDSFLFSSAYLPTEFPNNAPDGSGLSYAVAAAWGVPPAHEGWHLPAAAQDAAWYKPSQDAWHLPPPAASDAWGAGGPAASDAWGAGSSLQEAGGGSKMPVAEGGACDLSFLCAGIAAVSCEPG